MNAGERALKTYSCNISDRKGCEPLDQRVRNDTAEDGKTTYHSGRWNIHVFQRKPGFYISNSSVTRSSFLLLQIYTCSKPATRLYCGPMPSLLHLLQNSSALQLSTALPCVCYSSALKAWGGSKDGNISFKKQTEIPPELSISIMMFVQAQPLGCNTMMLPTDCSVYWVCVS